MLKIVVKLIVVGLLGGWLLSCASTPEITRGSANFIKIGTVSAKLRGNSFYVALGQANLYKAGLFGVWHPTGQAVDIAVAIQADPDTGEVERIVTVQSKNRGLEGGDPEDWQNNATVAIRSAYSIGDLRGGFSITDLQPYPKWLDALDAMQQDLVKLNAVVASTYHEDSSPTVTTEVIVDDHPWFPRFGGGWHGRFRR
jgi:hypothetical protein